MRVFYLLSTTLFLLGCFESSSDSVSVKGVSSETVSVSAEESLSSSSNNEDTPSSLSLVSSGAIVSISIQLSSGVITSSFGESVSSGSSSSSDIMNIIENGTFSDGLSHWRSSVGSAVDSILRIDIAKAGTSWSVNQSTVIALEMGTYQLHFRAKADKVRTIVTGIGMNHDPWNAESTEIALTTEWNSFNVKHSYFLNDTNSRLLFDVGAASGSVYIDDVVLIKITDGFSTDTTDKQWNLVWSDEFEYTGLPDSTKWSWEEMAPGTVNNELQRYVPPRTENARAENGTLIIEARKEPFMGAQYTSARLHTNGKGSWTHGKFEMRAKMPSGKGVWPAFWMMPSDLYRYASTCTALTGWIQGCNAWPNSGEIDIMEYVTYEPDKVHSSVHNLTYNFMGKNQKTGSATAANAENEFHIYSAVWSDQSIDFYIDAVMFFTYRNDLSGWKAWPYTDDFFILLNIAVGGDWGGAQGVDASITSWKYVIDYVRVYQRE